MTNSRATVNSSMQLLDKHIASGTEADYTYTPASELLIAKYSAYKIFITMDTTASLILELIINGQATGNYSRGTTTTTAIAYVSLKSNATELGLADATLIAAAQQIAGEITLQIDPVSGDIFGHSIFYSGGPISQNLMHYAASSATGLTSIKIQTSTSTWKANTIITIYGILK